MKKSIGLAALLSCVLLTGCTVEDLKFWENIDFSKVMFWKKDSETEEGNEVKPPVVEEKTITISEIPLVPVTGELDLSQYVTCSGGSGDFTVTLGESASEFAGKDISGKKIFAEHSGEVPFTINYSGISKESSITFVSEEYLSFLEVSDGRGYDYAVYGLDQNWQFIETCYNYAENFMVDLYSGEGYVESEDRVYSFTFDFDDQDEIFATYSLTGYEPETMSEISAPWSIDPSVLKCEYVPEETYQGRLYPAYEALYIDETATVNFFTEYIFGYSVELLARYDFVPSKVEFEEDFLRDDAGNMYPAYDCFLYVNGELENGEYGEGLFDYLIIDLNEGAFVADDLAELFATEKPHGQDYGEFVAIMDALIESKNYDVVYTAGWEDENGQKIANPFVTVDNEELGYYIHDYLMADDTITAHVTETQTYIENGSAEHSYGLVSHEGKVYAYEGAEHEAIMLSNSSSIFDDSLADEAANYVFLHTKQEIEESYIEQLFVNEVVLNDGSGHIAFSGSTAEMIFANLFVNAIPQKGMIDEEIEDVMEYLAQYDDINQTAYFLASENMVKYLSGRIDVVANQSVTISFTWDDEDDEQNEYFYTLSATFTNFGTAAIPGEVVVDYGK